MRVSLCTVKTVDPHRTIAIITLLHFFSATDGFRFPITEKIVAKFTEKQAFLIPEKANSLRFFVYSWLVAGTETKRMIIAFLSALLNVFHTHVQKSLNYLKK